MKRFLPAFIAIALSIVSKAYMSDFVNMEQMRKLQEVPTYPLCYMTTGWLVSDTLCFLFIIVGLGLNMRNGDSRFEQKLDKVGRAAKICAVVMMLFMIGFFAFAPLR